MSGVTSLGTFVVIPPEVTMPWYGYVIVGLVNAAIGFTVVYLAPRNKPSRGRGMNQNKAPYARPGLWVQITHRFGPRMPEWFLAAITGLLGIVLLLPEETFDQPAWSAFRAMFGDENLLGWLMLFLGLLRIGGLIVNGARKHVTPRIRQVSAGGGFLLFVGWSSAFAASGVISTWLAIYPTFAVMELVNIYRASKDVGGGRVSA